MSSPVSLHLFTCIHVQIALLPRWHLLILTCKSSDNVLQQWICPCTCSTYWPSTAEAISSSTPSTKMLP